MPVLKVLPLSLDDEELKAVQDAAVQVRPRDRGTYLADVTRELKRHEALGAGLVSRVARGVAQRLANGAAAGARAEARFKRRAD
jgi:hypothetical protein